MMNYSPTVTAATPTVAWAGRASTFPRERAPRVSRRPKPLLKRGRWRAPLNCIICPISPGRNGSGRGLPPGGQNLGGGFIPGVAPLRCIVLNRGGNGTVVVATKIPVKARERQSWQSSIRRRQAASALGW